LSPWHLALDRSARGGRTYSLVLFLNVSSASEMTYIVSGGALNSTHSLTFEREQKKLQIVKVDRRVKVT